jgi:hypothetical protein
MIVPCIWRKCWGNSSGEGHDLGHHDGRSSRGNWRVVMRLDCPDVDDRRRQNVKKAKMEPMASRAWLCLDGEVSQELGGEAVEGTQVGRASVQWEKRSKVVDQIVVVWVELPRVMSSGLWFSCRKRTSLGSWGLQVWKRWSEEPRRYWV